MRYGLFLFLVTLCSACAKDVEGSVCDEDNMATFHPRNEWDGDTWPIDRSLESKPSFDNLEKVLSHYQVNFQRIDPESIKVSCDLADSPELIRNYTAKALDKQWLENNGY